MFGPGVVRDAAVGHVARPRAAPAADRRRHRVVDQRERARPDRRRRRRRGDPEADRHRASPPTRRPRSSGTIDWADGEAVDPRVRRMGLVHAASNATALGLYGASLRRPPPRRPRPRQGARRSRALAVMSVGGFLGGHLSYARGVGVNQTAFDEQIDDWTDAIGADELTARRAEVGRRRRHARDARPPRRRHPRDPRPLLAPRLLADRRWARSTARSSPATATGRSSTCATGRCSAGPATTRQPVYETRESNGRIELRFPPSG